MNLLETLYEIKLKNHSFYDRKVKIQYKKTLLLGPRKSGKTHLIIDYLQNFDKNELLYIDFNDERIDIEDINYQKLTSFIEKNHIKVLILENFDFSFIIPEVQEIIISADIKNTNIEHFHSIHLYPLDFEEFILFDKKHFNIEPLFNLFTNHGSLPEVIQYNEENRYKQIQKISKDIFQSRNEFLIFKKFSEMQSTKVSLFQLYNQLKTKIKISKDFIYKTSQDLQERELIILLEKYQQKKSAKKVYLFDFAIKNALSFKKDFLKRFENMVFLELYKRQKDIYYTDSIDFFIEKEFEGIICAPFTPILTIKTKMKKAMSHFKALHVKKIWIITLGNEGGFEQENVNFTLIPFWDWALQN